MIYDILIKKNVIIRLIDFKELNPDKKFNSLLARKILSYVI